MKRKLLIGFGTVIMLLGAGMMYLNYRNRSLSPPDDSMLRNGQLEVKLSYSRPSVKGRTIFGAAESEAIQPYGKYWRLGANEPTEITINRDVKFNQIDLAAGTYQLYAIPREETFQIGVNTELRSWGYPEPDYSQDLLVTEVPVIRSANTEQHTMSLLPLGSDGVTLVVAFEAVRLEIPITTR